MYTFPNVFFSFKKALLIVKLILIAVSQSGQNWLPAFCLANTGESGGDEFSIIFFSQPAGQT